jgi:hypothetical protein
MAVLKSASRTLPVPCRCLIGRSALADVRLTSRKGSSEHATLGWYSGRWVLRDLGSSNGTRVNGKALFPGDRVGLQLGGAIQFGDDDELFTFADDDAPEPCAVRLGPQQTIWGAQTLLVLPTTEAPEASVFAGPDGWRLDTGAEVRVMECGDVAALPSGYYRLLLPEVAGSARARTAVPEFDLAELSLSFRVAPEKISVTLCQGARTVTVPPRACLSTLIALARIRMQSRLPDSERGWVSSMDLADMLRYTPEKVNVDIHRLRKLFQEAGVRNAPQIVERDDAKRLRLGVHRLDEQHA